MLHSVQGDCQNSGVTFDSRLDLTSQIVDIWKLTVWICSYSGLMSLLVENKSIELDTELDKASISSPIFLLALTRISSLGSIFWSDFFSCLGTKSYIFYSDKMTTLAQNVLLKLCITVF